MLTESKGWLMVELNLKWTFRWREDVSDGNVQEANWKYKSQSKYQSVELLSSLYSKVLLLWLGP